MCILEWGLKKFELHKEEERLTTNWWKPCYNVVASLIQDSIVWVYLDWGEVFVGSIHKERNALLFSATFTASHASDEVVAGTRSRPWCACSPQADSITHGHFSGERRECSHYLIFLARENANVLYRVAGYILGSRMWRWWADDGEVFSLSAGDCNGMTVMHYLIPSNSLETVNNFISGTLMPTSMLILMTNSGRSPFRPCNRWKRIGRTII